MICVDCEQEFVPGRFAAMLYAKHPDHVPYCGGCAEAATIASKYADRIDIALRCVGVGLKRWRAWAPTARHKTATVNGYLTPPGSSQAKQAAVAWRKAWGTEQDRPGLYLWGESGSGKSHLAIALAKAVRHKNLDLTDPVTWGVDVPVEYRPEVARLVTASRGETMQYRAQDVIAVEAVDLIAEMKMDLDFAETIITDCRECDLLVLDDLGAERDTGFAVEQLYRVIKDRLDNGKPLIVTSNFDPASTMTHSHRENERADDATMMRLASRILGGCEVVHVETPDFRVRPNRPQAAAHG